MLDWIFEGIVQWIAGIVSELMDAVSGIFLEALGTEMTAMEEYFPFAKSAFEIFQYTAWAILLLITVWQLFRAFGGPITEAENPWHLILQSALFAVLIQFAKPIFTTVLSIARGPYTALMDQSIDPGDFTFAGIENILANSITTIASIGAVVGLILILILMIALGWNYFKLLLEVVERYVVVGVLCYTSPLAFSLGGSKSTGNVFKSWCRMVGSQLILLILNVWFLRAFNSSVGQFIANGGALSTGQGNIFLWMFCALALLKVGQKFDSHLASIGLSVAQTGGSMGMELLMAGRMLAGAGGGSKSAGSVFQGGTSGAAGAAGAATSGFASWFSGNSFVRDAVMEGGAKMAAGGSFGIVGRAFGGMAARNGATLNAASVASVAGKPPGISGKIGGDIADRSIGNFMPHLADKQVSGTQISGGHISTQAVGANGKEAALELYSAGQFEKPGGASAVVSAADGSQWYQTASGAGSASFFPTPSFTGDPAEAGQYAQTFPGIPEGTLLRTMDEGKLEATAADGGSSLWYNSGHFMEPDAPHSVMTDTNGVNWYAMQPSADMDALEISKNDEYFRSFMPGYEQSIAEVKRAAQEDGQFEVRHKDGSGTAFYDQTMYQPPRGDYRVYEDANGGQWYALGGTPGVDRVPVYQNGNPVYDDNGKLVTKDVETVKYKTGMTRYAPPENRDPNDAVVPRRRS